MNLNEVWDWLMNNLWTDFGLGSWFIDRVQQADPLQLYTAIIGTGVLLVYVAYPRRPRHHKGPREMTDQRIFEVHFADAITEAIENGLHKGRWTEKQAQKMYRKCANKLRLPDLKPKSLILKKLHAYKVELLKKAIKLRTHGGPSHVTPVPIPEPSRVVLLRPTTIRKKKRA